MKESSWWKGERSAGAFFLLAFAFLFVFFTQVHPFVVYDGDDWRYIAYTRQALPNWNEWNPSRVFAECFAPMTGYFAAYVLFPLLGDYFRALTVAAALLTSTMITGYLYVFYRMVRGTEDGRFRALALTAIFLFFHFLIMKTERTGNPHMFSTANFTCLYYYVMPMLLNGALVMLVAWQGRLEEIYRRTTPIQAGFLSFWIYFAVFSNVFQSIIFPAFLGVYVLYDFLAQRGMPIRSWLRGHRAELVVLGVWLFSLAIEMRGGRAHAIGQDFFHLPFGAVWQTALSSIHHVNAGVVGAGLVFIVLAAVSAWRRRGDADGRRTLGVLAASFAGMVLTFVFLFLVCAKAGPGYFGRADVFSSVLFFLVFAIVYAMDALVRRYPALVKALPIVTFVVMIAAMNPNRGFHESTSGGLPAQTCYAVDADILQQVLDAQATGATQATIHVPLGNGASNWPHDFFLKNVLRNTLTRHGLLVRPLELTIEPDAAMNETYHLPVPTQEPQREGSRNDG